MTLDTQEAARNELSAMQADYRSEKARRAARTRWDRQLATDRLFAIDGGEPVSGRLLMTAIGNDYGFYYLLAILECGQSMCYRDDRREFIVRRVG